MVFRGRHRRLEVEIVDLLRARYGLSPVPREPRWFLSDVFFELTAEIGDSRLPQASERVLAAIRKEPARFMYDDLANTPDGIRMAAVARFSEGSENLRRSIEARRAPNANESLSMRRKISSANLMIYELDLILSFVRKAGLLEPDENIILRNNARSIINECPTYYIEREIGLRTEAQSRAIEENDFRDMQALCAVTAYADIVVAENIFVNLAVQAGLDRRYGTFITTNLADILPALRADEDTNTSLL